MAEAVVDILTYHNYLVDAVSDGEDALSYALSETYDGIILDIMMPGIDGFTCCREIRKKSQVPVIFLTAKDEEIDKVVGFELGADDYVVKPFKPRELMARVKARLRRTSVDASRVQAQSVLEAGGVTIDEAAYTASVLGEELALTPKEYAILLCLAKQAGRPVASSELFEAVWGEPASVQGNNTVMVHIRHLRKKIAAIDSSQEYIETVWGVGYKLG